MIPLSDGYRGSLIASETATTAGSGARMRSYPSSVWRRPVTAPPSTVSSATCEIDGRRSSSATAAQRHAPSPSADCWPKRTRSASSRAKRSGESVGGGEEIGAVERVVGHEHRPVGAHRERLPQRVGGARGPERDDDDLALAGRVAHAQRLLDRMQVEVGDREVARAVEPARWPGRACGPWRRRAQPSRRRRSSSAQHSMHSLERSPPGQPERLLPARVRRARQHEEQVGEPVQVHGRERVHRPLDAPPRAPPARPGGRPRARRAAARRPRSRPAGRSSAARRAARSPRRSRPRAGRWRAARPGAVPSPSANGTERSAPRSKSSFWMRASRAIGGDHLHPPEQRVQLVDRRRRRARAGRASRRATRLRATSRRRRRRACRSASAGPARHAAVELTPAQRYFGSGSSL